MARSKTPQQANHGYRRFVADNGLAIACFALFFAFLAGQSLTGWQVHNDDAQQHGGHAIGYLRYLSTGHFYEAVFENWESEFLQMGAFVLLTVFLVQRGSAESKHPDGHNDVDTDPARATNKRDAPWPVRRGGIWLTLYSNSLLIAFFALFLMSILGHGLSGAPAFGYPAADQIGSYASVGGRPGVRRSETRSRSNIALGLVGLGGRGRSLFGSGYGGHGRGRRTVHGALRRGTHRGVVA